MYYQLIYKVHISQIYVFAYMLMTLANLDAIIYQQQFADEMPNRLSKLAGRSLQDVPPFWSTGVLPSVRKFTDQDILVLYQFYEVSAGAFRYLLGCEWYSQIIVNC